MGTAEKTTGIRAGDGTLVMMFISRSEVPLVNAKLPSKGWLSAKRVELSETKEPEKVMVCESEDASKERR